MAYRTKATECVVQLVRLRLTEEQAATCERLRHEAGRCWSDLVRYHHSARTVGEWPSGRDLEIAGAAGGYALHSQTIQALAQQLDATLHCHKASRQAVQLAQAAGVRELAVGAMQDSQQGVALRRHTNQKMSQWPRGQVERYLGQKARRVGIPVRRIPEDYSTCATDAGRQRPREQPDPGLCACNQRKGEREGCEFLAHHPQRLAHLRHQAQAPLADAAAVNSTRLALLECLRGLGVPV